MNEIERRAKKIEEVLNNPNYKKTSDFAQIVQDLNSPNNINFDDYYLLIHMTMYLYHQEFGLQQLIDKDFKKGILKNKINFNIQRDISFEEFENELYEYYKIKNDDNKTGYDSNKWPTYYDIIVQIFGREKLHYGATYFKVYHECIIEDKNDGENKYSGKIYLSIDSKDLFEFAILLLQKCLENNKIPTFSFKIYNYSDSERLDSICIYFTKENFHKYIQMIQEIKEENPTMQFNTPNFLAHQYNEYIAVAKDASPGYSFEGHTFYDSKSFTYLSQFALELVQKQTTIKNNHELALKASELIENFLAENGIIKLCEETKKRLSTPIQNNNPATNQPLQLNGIIKTKFNSKETYSSLLEKFKYYFVKIPTIKSNPGKEALIKAKIYHNFSNNTPYESVIKWAFEHMYEFSKNVTLHLFEESLDIMILVKNGYPPNEIKEIIQQFEHYDIILSYLSGFMEPEFLKKITPNSSFSK